MTTIHKVVLIGASGRLGSVILEALQSNPTFEITILSRPESTSSFPSHLHVVKTELTAPNLIPVLKGQHAVINAAGIPAVTAQYPIIDACVEAGVHRYITNDFGNPRAFPGLPELEYARKNKLDVLRYVMTKANEHGNFTWSALATGHFVDLAMTKYPAAFGFDLDSRTARLVDGGTERFSSTTMRDIARAVVGILLRSGDTANRFLHVRSLETTQLEILRALQGQTGPWTVEYEESGVLYERGKRRMADGDRGGMMDLLAVQIFEAGVGRSSLPPDSYDNKLLGVEEMSVDELVRSVLAST